MGGGHGRARYGLREAVVANHGVREAGAENIPAGGGGDRRERDKRGRAKPHVPGGSGRYCVTTMRKKGKCII